MMNKIEEAIIYATVMHQGKVRKLGNIPKRTWGRFVRKTEVHKGTKTNHG